MTAKEKDNSFECGHPDTESPCYWNICNETGYRCHECLCSTCDKAVCDGHASFIKGEIQYVW